MKNMMKKNQMIITALAIMIAVAGYLNFVGAKPEQEEAASFATGEAVEVNAEASVAAEEEDAFAMDISDEDIYIAEQNISENMLSEIESMDAEADAGLPETEEPGAAVFTSALTQSSAGVASGAKLLKEQTRAKNKETLLEVINSAVVTDTQKQEAIDSMISMVDIAERETAAEILLSAKGFTDVVVSISDGMADVLVNSYELSDAERAQIEDVIKRKTGIPPENLVITPIEVVE